VSFLMNPKKNRKILAYPALYLTGPIRPIPEVSKSAGMSGPNIKLQPRRASIGQSNQCGESRGLRY
jgi:hypothetical protein